MPPILIPPLARIALGALGAGAAIHWVAKELRRLNEEFERARSASAVDAAVRSTFPTLRRDPRSGEWRVS
jgi:hypothetical protein